MPDPVQRDNPYHVNQASRIYFLPNLMTAGNLFCGFIAIIKCIQARLITDLGDYYKTHEILSANTLYTQAVWCILIAVVFDMLDGRLARMSGRTSLFGAEFDSLADVISFGMAPALMVFFLILAPRENYQWFREFGWLIAFVYLLCGAVRLARFNVITHPLLYRGEAESNKDFVGLPIPAAAGTVASLVLLLLNLSANDRELGQWALALPFILVLVSVLMVSTVRYPSFKQVDFEMKARLKYAVLLFIIGVVVWRWHEISFFFLFLGYISYGLFAHYQRSVRHAQRRLLRNKVVKMRQESSE